MALGDELNSGSQTESSGTDCVVALGATATAGSLLVAAHYSGRIDGHGVDEGWTLGHELERSADTDKTLLWWKVSDGTETNVTLTSSPGNNHIGILVEIEGPWGAPALGTVGDTVEGGSEDPSSGTAADGAIGDVTMAFCVWCATNGFRTITAATNSYNIIAANVQHSTKTMGFANSPLRSTSQSEESTATSAGSANWHGVIFQIAPGGGGAGRRKKATACRSGIALSQGRGNGNEAKLPPTYPVFKGY